MDTLFYNGRIASLNSRDDFYEALGIMNNKIVYLGSSKDAPMDKFEQRIDLKGRVMLPAFNDSHMHLLNYGYTKSKLSLGGISSIAEMIQIGKAHIKNHSIKKGGWLLGRGWNQDNLMEKRFPLRSDLDKISEDIPIVFTRTCGHIAVCNSAAIQLLCRDTIKDTNIEWENGIFKESALEILYEKIDSPDKHRIKEMLLDTCSELLSYGITSVQTDDFDAMPDRDFRKVIEAYQELEKEGALKVRIYEQCLLPQKEMLEEFFKLGYKTGVGSSFFRIGPLKLLQDGALGGRTALLADEYSDDPGNKGIETYSQEKLDDYLSFAHENGMQIAVHAIGDRAMEMVLKALSKAQESFRRNDPRHGIVHCQITSDALISDFSSQDVIAYIQPIFLDYDLHIVGQRVGKRAERSYAFKTMLNTGIHVCLGTDAPVVHFNPFENIFSAVTRKDLSGFPGGGFIPSESLSVTEALKAYTISSAYSSFEEGLKGTLELGKLADLIILDKDIFTVSHEEIKDLKVMMTIVDGNIVFQRDNSIA